MERASIRGAMDAAPAGVDLFQDHDVVFLGGRHYIRDDALLVMPAGDEPLARHIQFQQHVS